jgi:hypothetical protein
MMTTYQRPTIPDEPYKCLATAVIMQAIKDKRLHRAEVTRFFQSDLFELYADLARVNPDIVRAQLHIPERKRIPTPPRTE